MSATRLRTWAERALCIGGFFALLMLPGVVGDVLKDRMGVRDLPAWSVGVGAALGMGVGFLLVYTLVPRRKLEGE